MNATQKAGIVYGPMAVSYVLSITDCCDPALEPVEGFITFYDPGWSIERLRNAVAKKGTIFFPQNWYDNEPFARLDEPPRYRQLRMTAVADSFDKTIVEQQALLSTDEEVPSARVIVMGMVIHLLATGERLFPNCWVRCIDKDSDGDRVEVGYFDARGFCVRNDWDACRAFDLGLASSRKF